VTELAAHGLLVELPAGWEGRIFRRPQHGELAATAADGPPAPAGATTHAVAHFSTIPLPADTGDFASSAVPHLGPDDALIVVFEHAPSSVGQPLFAAKGFPRTLDTTSFSPSTLQRALPGQAGAQRFFTEADRAFCLYVVLGAYARRSKTVPMVNAVLATIRVDGASGTTAPTTTAPTTTVPTTTVPTTTAPGTTAPATTAPATTGPTTTTRP
jgi:hypothetical protein